MINDLIFLDNFEEITVKDEPEIDIENINIHNRLEGVWLNLWRQFFFVFV